MSASVERWLPFATAPADVRLYCLPHAGGSASTYRAWANRLDGVAICPVQPPGRETRMRETPFRELTPLVTELADVLSEHIDSPFAIYGHSLGGLVGFELVRELRRRGLAPVQLIVSGCPAPNDEAHDDGPPVANMSQHEVVQLLRTLGGTPEWLLADPTALQMILPPFQADFSVKETYGYRSEALLDVPITAIASTRDVRVSPLSMTGWQAETSAEFRQHTMTGGHFAVLEHAPVTLGLLAQALAPWLTRTPLALGA